MEDFLLFILCVAVVWLAVRQANAGATFDELRNLIERLEQRIKWLESSPKPSPTPTPEATPKPKPTPEPVPAATQPAYPDLRPYEAKPAYTPRPPAVPAQARLAEPEAPPPTIVVEPIPAPRLPPAPPSFAAATAAPARSISLEERLGRNWLSKLGIISVVIGVALFLGVQLRTLGPLGKSLLGLTFGLILLLGGLLLERRETYRLFARAGIGGGWALLFFVTFALYHVDAMQVLHSQAIDLELMLFVAFGMIAHSLLYRSQTVTALAFLLAFATVGISHVTLFSLVAGAVLAAALVCVAWYERWYELALAGLVAAYLNHFLWLTRVLPEGGQPGHPFPQFLASAALLILYWFIFRVLFVFRVPLNPRQQLVSAATAILNSAGLLLLLKYQSAHPEWTFAALLALGAAEGVFAFLALTRWRIAFVVLSTLASAFLLAAIPFRFSGAHWTILWLLEAEILFIAGIRMPERIFRRLGMIAWFCAALQIALFELLPIFDLRQSGADPSHHIPAAIALFTTAAIFWLNSEWVSRRWKDLFVLEPGNTALLVTSYLAAAMLAFGLWVVLPAPWPAVVWLAAAVLLAYTARRLQSADLASQADLLAAVALVRLVAINFYLPGDLHSGHFGLRALTIALAAVFLYAGMGRRQPSHLLPAPPVLIPAAWSTAATGLIAALAWYELRPTAVAIAWGVLGLILFELGTFFRRSYLRLQAYALFVLSFARILLVNLDFDTKWHVGDHHRLYTVVPLIAAYLWVYERTRRALADSDYDRFCGTAAAWLGTAAATTLLYFEMPSELFHTQQVVIAWSALAALLLYTGWILRRPTFVAQSLIVLAATAADAVLNNLLIASNSAGFWASRTFFVSAGCALMLLSLPAAFAIRRRSREVTGTANSLDLLLAHPEQPFFFVPLVLIALLIAIEQTGGGITIGWIVLGLAAFLAALPIGERSFRLAGLGLLLLGLAKIVFLDIWSATPTDRYLTLIVTGVALLLVSFLYSRYRETILKFL